jgi:succinoglycan biosynthesis transport protein ExoP
MEMKIYLEILGRRWRVILIVMVVISGLAIYASRYILPSYQAETQLRVITPEAGSFGDTYHETTFANRVMNTYVQIATSEQVMNDLKKKLNLETLPDISVKIIPDSEIILIVVESSNPSLAATTANGLAEVIISKQDQVMTNSTSSEELNILTDRRNELETELTQAKAEQDRLIPIYSHTLAQIAVLDRAIRMKEASYQTFLNQNRLAEVNGLENELKVLNQQYEELSTNSNKYLQQLTMLRQTIQNDQTAYSDLLYRYDSVLSASYRKHDAQNLLITSTAIEPSKPSGLGGWFIIGLGVICGLIGGVVLAFVFDNLDTRIFTPEQLGLTTTLPVLGRFPQIHELKSRDAVLQSEYPTVHRDYWMLCARLLATIKSGPVKTILVTSPNPREGKSIITSSLAMGLARNNCKVLIVDADMRGPQQQKMYQVSGKKDLSTFLGDENCQVEDVIRKNVRPGIDLLPSLTAHNDPTDLFQSTRLRVLFEKIKTYDVVLFDTPALLAAPDAYRMATIVDGVLVVVQRGHTTSGDVRSICDHLEAIGSKILGVVVNQVPGKTDSNYYHRKTGWLKRFTERLESISIKPLHKSDRHAKKTFSKRI